MASINAFNILKYISIVAFTFTCSTANSLDIETSTAQQVADSLYLALKEGNEEKLRGILDPEVLIYESGGVESSLEEYAGHHMHSDMKFMSGVERELLSRRVFESDGFAVVATESRLHGTFQERKIDVKSIETLLLQRTEDGWRVAHIHWSSR